MTVLSQQQSERSHTELPPPHGAAPTGQLSDGSTPLRHNGSAASSADGASVGELVAQLSGQLSRLARDEIALAEIEAKERGKRAGVAIGALGVGGVLGFLGACCFVTAAIIALAMVMRPWSAALCVGAGLIIVSGMFGTPGLWGLRRTGKGAGRQSIESVKADVDTLRQVVRK